MVASFRGLARLSLGCCHVPVTPPSCLSAGLPHLARVRTPRTPVARVADDEGNRLTCSKNLSRRPISGVAWRTSACSEKSEHAARHLGGGRGRAVACAHWLARRRKKVARVASSAPPPPPPPPPPVSPQARPVNRGVTRASPKLAERIDSCEVPGKSRARLIPQTFKIK